MIKKKKDERLINLQTKVRNNIGKLCDFNNNINLVSIKTNSCYDFNKATLSKVDNFVPFIDNSNDDIPKYKSKIVNMSINEKQSDIIHKWFDSYIDMYNEVIHFFIKSHIYDDIRNLKIIKDDTKVLYLDMIEIQKEIKTPLKLKKKLNSEYDKLIQKRKIKNKASDNELIKLDKIRINSLNDEIVNIKTKIKNLNIILDTKTKKHKKSLSIQKKEYGKLMTKLNWKNVRTKHLKNIRDHIQSNSTNNNSLRIRTHILDCAIKNACASYKSCTSNFLNGNIKKFKIRYWRHNKKNRTMEIEKEFIRNNELLLDIFGTFKLTYDNEKYVLTGNETVTILYRSDIKNIFY